jgi:vacuolar-type H+-ATPase subunit E/Vma4
VPRHAHAAFYVGQEMSIRKGQSYSCQTISRIHLKVRRMTHIGSQQTVQKQVDEMNTETLRLISKHNWNMKKISVKMVIKNLSNQQKVIKKKNKLFRTQRRKPVLGEYYNWVSQYNSETNHQF